MGSTDRCAVDVPELPEVETTRRGIRPHLEGRRIARAVVREARLRWPVPSADLIAAHGAAIDAVERRGKYLLIRTQAGTIMLHLGMSGSLRIVHTAVPPLGHDHLDIELDDGHCLRLRDPRRFSSVHWLPGADPSHPLLDRLGPEPWDATFTGSHLYHLARGRRRSVKAFLMDSRIVVGVGNIYANEALFEAGIHPTRAAGRIAEHRFGRLAEAVQRVLERAIAVGGTTLRNFTDPDGEPGYFRIELAVYGRSGGHCRQCGAGLRSIRQQQRATWYCPHCQR